MFLTACLAPDKTDWKPSHQNISKLNMAAYWTKSVHIGETCLYRYTHEVLSPAMSKSCAAFLLPKISSNSGVSGDRITLIHGGVTFFRNELPHSSGGISSCKILLCRPSLDFFGLKIVDFYIGLLPSVSQINVFSGNQCKCLMTQTLCLGNSIVN